VRVYRDAKEVFTPAALQSFEYIPVTDEHPTNEVNPTNVRNLFHGVTKAPVVVDGNHAKVGVVLMSDAIIAKYNGGKKQVSCGYRSGIVWGEGRTQDGEIFDARQVSIQGNHLALVHAGRAGTARIVDDEGRSIMADTNTTAAEELGKVKQQLADTQDALAKLKKESGEQVAALTKDRDELAGKLQAAEAAKLSDEALKKLVDEGVAAALEGLKARQGIVDKAKAFAPALEVTDSMTTRDIMTAALSAKFGDGFVKPSDSDDQVAGAFNTLQFTPGKQTDAKPATAQVSGLPTLDAVRSLVRR
jgi:hypothetical protein